MDQENFLPIHSDIKLRNYITDLSLEFRNEVLALLNPYITQIKSLNTNYIGCREFYKDGTSLAFCSNNSWYNAPSNDEFRRDMSMHYFNEILSLNKTGFDHVIRTPFLVTNRFLKELLKCDMCNSIIFYQKDKNTIRHYSFISSANNNAALDIFFNKKSTFEKIFNSFKIDLEVVFKKEKYHNLREVIFPNNTASMLFDCNNIQNSSSIGYNLTLREEECIKLLKDGATDKDIAYKFNISTRTVAYHISNIKKKCKLSSRFGIIEFAKRQSL